MPTNSLLRAETRSLAIDAPPATVLDFLADPRNLPRWAPGVAKSVRVDGDDWLLDNGETEVRITPRTSLRHGTVDLLTGPGAGVFTRVLPNGDGSEYQFTLFFPADTPEAAVEDQLKIVEAELRTVRDLCTR
ncbi:polyketide cyclase/dehydrase/lipid transport protein [Kribbella amoyensis]|uniref:Polyketide cyclase/dehydrase/lipid transport protein n=1 Tax=Kribbella amoyensis TaxID=996641 RepID=A0A561BS68_9ACTN|nr:SRPBCC family protein [Kribbella amoyensis]TWD81734.1 polyketide cyclase/dehydrase/lipid transport protein [Kribbella amoyensis]